MERGLNRFRKQRDDTVNARIITQSTFFDDFISDYGLYVASSDVTNSIWGYGLSTGSTIVQKSAVAGEGFGIIQLNGASSNNAVFSQVDGLVFGAKDWYFATKVKFPLLVTAGDNHEFFVGFTDGIGTFADGASFFYTSTNVWRTRTAKSIVPTTIITSSPIVADRWYILEIFVDKSASSAQFFVDENLISTHVTNIPKNSVSQATGFGFSNRKVNGITTKSICLDRLYVA